MKNISLILIVLLLYTFPLFAQTNRSNFMYQWKNGSKYFGDWENGTMHGEGTYTFGIGKGEGDRYVGEYRNGIRSGKGIILGLTAKGMLEISRMMCLTVRAPTNF